MYVLAAPRARDDAKAWHALLPQPGLRVSLRRLKLGLMPNAKVTMTKCMPASVGQAWRLLSDAMQTDMVHCECTCGVQNASHLWFDCSRTDALRDDVCVAAARVVDAEATPAHQRWWHGLSRPDQLRHVASSCPFMGAPVEKALRAVCVPLLVDGLSAVLRDLGDANALFYSDVCALAL